MWGKVHEILISGGWYSYEYNHSNLFESLIMRGEGFEPSQALSYYGLNVTRLTTPALPHEKIKLLMYLKL